MIRRGTVDCLTEESLRKRLADGKPLRVKAGFDPTAPDLHLGHTVLMHKLRQFQELGHQVIFLIGDFTARIGDPSGRTKMRPPLSDDEIVANARTYTDQAFKILDRETTEVRFNAEWLNALSPAEMVHLSAQYTLARMMEREDFAKRFDAGHPLSLHELWYPLFQGYDSVVLKADVELGGQDQKFNLVVAREIQKAYGQSPEIVVTMPLLVGTDGVQKMSKSYGNHIAIRDAPAEMFGKLMSIADETMWHYYELLSDRSAGEVARFREGHPKAAKVALATELVSRFHSPEAAGHAAEEFDRVFAKKEKPSHMAETHLAQDGDPMLLVDILVQCGGVGKSKGEIRRLMVQKGVRVNGEAITDIQHRLSQGEYEIQAGKRWHNKVVIR